MSLHTLQALNFLINTLFSLYILCVMLRFFLQWVKADFYNPFCQFLIKLTNPLLVPLRRIIPGWFGLDMAAVVLMILLECVNVLLIACITSYPLSAYLVIVAIGKLIRLILNMYFFTILIRALMSWFNHNPYHPMTIVLTQLTEPVLRPIRRIIPTMGGIDWSPLIALILIEVISILFGGVIGI